MGAGVRDAFPPPMCVWIVYAFRLGKSHVNGYFICVGLRGKILRSVVGAVPVCPPVSPHKGASIVHPPRTMRVFLLWKRRCADVRAGTQAPPLRFRLGGLRMDGFVCWLVKTVHMNQHYRCCTFDSPGLIEHSEIYPGESRGGEPMPSALYFLKSICVRETICSPRVVMMCDEKKYNPQGVASSLALLPRVGCVALANPALSKV